MVKQTLNRPLGMREPAVIEQVGSTVLYRAMREDKWLVPVVHRHKLMIFDAGDVAQAWARIKLGELPKSLQRETTGA